MNDLQNLSTLKRNRDEANQQFLDAIERIRQQLPEGVEITLDEEVLGASITPVVEEIIIASKSDVVEGDTLRWRGGSHGRLVEGQDYQVTHIDLCGDPRIRVGGRERFDTCGCLSSFRIVRNRTPQSEGNQWKTLHRGNRHELKEGDEIRFTQSGEDITAGRIYRIAQKPDDDGRFRDDADDRRDTDTWTYPQGSSSNIIEFRSA